MCGKDAVRSKRLVRDNGWSFHARPLRDPRRTPLGERGGPHPEGEGEHGGPEGALPEYSLALWHGLNLPLAMSALALATGESAWFAVKQMFNSQNRRRLVDAADRARGAVHLPERAEQVRGYTWFHAILMRSGIGAWPA